MPHPLQGRRVVVTRSARQSSVLSELLREAGAEPILLPTIEIVPPSDWAPLDLALQSVAQYDGITVAAVSPSQIVPTPGTVYHKLVAGIDDPRGEQPTMMARAALLLASEPAAKVNGRVTYSQQILKEFGWIDRAAGRGVDSPGSGYSQI